MNASPGFWFGPKAPAGKESNWVPTSAKGKFEVLFRLYGPEKSFFHGKVNWVQIDVDAAAQDGTAIERQLRRRREQKE